MENKLFLYEDALAYLDSLDPLGIKLGLERVQRVLEVLGNPQNSFPSVVVAGTNGKGSTSAMLASILQEGGYTVGLYTSPHLTHFCERIQINGVPVSEAQLCGLVKKLQTLLEKHGLENTLTYFEFITILSFLHFAEQSVDIAVLEVGLGGRLDAVNVVTPLVSCITEIDLDHQAFLGESLCEIAREKGGIIKKNGAVVLTSRKNEAVQVISEICSAMDASLFAFGRDFSGLKSEQIGVVQSLDFSSKEIHLKGLIQPLQGDHQIENAANALQAALLLNKSGIPLKETHIRNGLKNTTLPCRFEFIQGSPSVLLDVAHNPPAIESMVRTFRQLHGHKKLIFVVGMMKDKNIEAIFRIIGPEAKVLILVGSKSQRAADPEQLQAVAEKQCNRTVVAENISQALSTAFLEADKDDVICITGSFHVVGDARRQVLKILNQRNEKRALEKGNE